MDEASPITRKYWIAQNSRYATTMNDSGFLEDQELKKKKLSGENYIKYLPTEPSHHRAHVPDDVRYAKRKDQGFRCAIRGWRETDWVQDKQKRGPVRRVGVLTVDHIIPGAKGGMTTDENIKMVCEFVNAKKADKEITYEQMRDRVLGAYELVELPVELEQILIKYGVREYRV